MIFNRLPGFPSYPAGLERVVLRRLPGWWLFGTLMPILPVLVARIPFAAYDERRLASADIWVASLVILHWTVLFTVGIAAFIVMVMKGPADPYPLAEKNDERP
jgi:hypothetical protein